MKTIHPIIEVLFEQNPTPTILVDDKTQTIVDLNLASEQLYGISKKYCIGKPIGVLAIDENNHNFNLSNKGYSEILSHNTQGDFYDIDIKTHPIEEKGQTLIFCTPTNNQTLKNNLNFGKFSTVAQKITTLGFWEVDLIRNKLFWSDEVYRIHEVDLDKPTPSLDNAINYYRDDFRVLVSNKLNHTIATGEDFIFEAVIVTEKLNEKWIKSIGTIATENGKPSKIYGSIVDINELKKAEHRNKTIANVLPGVSCEYLIYPDGTDDIQNISDGTVEVWGYKKEEARANLADIWERAALGGDLEILQQSIQESIQNQKQWVAKWRYLHPNGELKLLKGYGSPTILANGTVLFNNLIFDITEQAKDKELLTQASNIANVGSWEYVLLGDEIDELYLSLKTKNILEIESNFSLNYRNVKTFLSESNFTHFKNLIKSLIRYGKEFEEDFFMTTKNKTNKWVTIHGKSERVNNKCIKIYGSLQDCTDIKNLEFQFKDILKSISDTFCAFDKDWKFIYLNDKAEKFFKKERQFLIGKNIWEEYPEIKDTIVETNFKKVLKNGANKLFEYQNPSNNKWYEINVNSFYTGISVSFRDVNDRKKTTEELVHLNTSLQSYSTKLEKSNQELEHFAFVTSHDLQEPLRMVISFLDLLKKKYATSLDEKANKYIYYATDAAKRMKQLVSDILTYSRVNINDDKLSLVNLNNIISDFKTLRAKIIEEKKAVITSDKLPSINSYNVVFVQIFHALLDNALKYSKNNIPPIIYISCKDQGDNWLFSVEDNGIGIAEEYYDKIFVIFKRLHTNNSYSGTGIGLSYVKKCIDFLGGRIWVESQLDVGTKFKFIIQKNKENV